MAKLGVRTVADLVRLVVVSGPPDAALGRSPTTIREGDAL
ncbi:hypothetical protein [Sinorhizobium meliloti]